MKSRKSNIELLRIFSMLLIITLHFTGHCIDVTYFEVFSPLWFIGWLIRGIGYISVNCYVLVSGYFLCKSEFKIKKLLLLVFETLFYSVSIYLLLLLTNKVDFSVFSFIKSCIPILSGEYWFVTIYTGLYLLSPFLNLTLNNMTQKLHFSFCILLFVIFSVIPTFAFFSKWLNYGGGYGIVWFIVLYFISSYIRKYVNIEKLKKYRIKLCLITLVLWIAPLISKCIIAKVTIMLTGKVIGSSIFYNNISIIILFSSISTFLLFLTIEIKGCALKKFILFFGKSTFGVYLIHDNNYVRPLLWNYVSKYVGCTAITYFISSVIIIVSIFILCALIDIIRQYLFSVFKLQLLCTFIANKVKKLSDSFINKVFIH